MLGGQRGPGRERDGRGPASRTGRPVGLSPGAAIAVRPWARRFLSLSVGAFVRRVKLGLAPQRRPAGRSHPRRRSAGRPPSPDFSTGRRRRSGLARASVPLAGRRGAGRLAAGTCRAVGRAPRAALSDPESPLSPRSRLRVSVGFVTGPLLPSARAVNDLEKCPSPESI